MTPLMLAGLVPSGTPEPDGTPAHHRIPTGGHVGLALPLAAGIDLSDDCTAITLAQAQHALLCRYAETADVLPVALGGVFSGADSLGLHLAREASNIATLAERLAGRIEYSLAINLLPDRSAPGVAATGRDHLRQRARIRDDRTGRVAARRAFLESVSESLRPVTEAQRMVAGKDPGRLARIDALIERIRLAAFRSVIEVRLAEAETLGLALTLTGPYPAFTFSGAHADG
jgi:hypothetical protein